LELGLYIAIVGLTQQLLHIDRVIHLLTVVARTENDVTKLSIIGLGW
jgi:hypothetical protein